MYATYKFKSYSRILVITMIDKETLLSLGWSKQLIEAIDRVNSEKPHISLQEPYAPVESVSVVSASEIFANAVVNNTSCECRFSIGVSDQ